jgi:ABC-type branched-subunit amino acid transport system substrate-binding protein
VEKGLCVAGKDLCRVRIGAIVTLSGSNEKIGRGILSSIHHVLAHRKAKLAQHGIEASLVWRDDHGQAVVANRAAEECLHEGCVALIGPCDSISMREVLSNPAMREMPKLCTFATATALSALGDPAFFRFTHNDRQRSVHLVKKIVQVVPQAKKVAICYLRSPVGAYSQSLKADAVAAVESQGLQYDLVEFTVAGPLVRFATPADRSQPVIVCSPSKQAGKFIKELRNRRHGGGVFAFGSNSNFRQRELAGTIVVTDLDRYDPNLDVQQALGSFAARFPGETEPSIATMSATEALIDVLLEAPAGDWEEAGLARERIISRLRRGGVEGLLGPLGFDSRGEMLGKEPIALLEVVKTRHSVDFQVHRGQQLPAAALPGVLARLWLPIASLAAVTVFMITALAIEPSPGMIAAIGLASTAVALAGFGMTMWERMNPGA